TLRLRFFDWAMIRGSSSFSKLWPVALTVKLWLRMHAILVLRLSMSFYTHGNHIFLPDSDHTVANNDWVKKHAGKQYGYWPNGSSDLSSATRTSPAAKRGRSLTSTSSASSSASVGKSIC